MAAKMAARMNISRNEVVCRRACQSERINILVSSAARGRPNLQTAPVIFHRDSSVLLHGVCYEHARARNSMLHPDTELRYVNSQIGYGVFALRHIPKGTITWVRDDLDQAFEPEEILKFSRPYRDLLDKYTFRDREGRAVLCWDLARYLNHSCEANCIAAGYEFEIAVRDIECGEELTDDYGTMNLTESFPCSCGKARCRNTVQPEDFNRLWENWDGELRHAFARLNQVQQPLRDYFKNFLEVEEAASQPAKMRSCRFNYFPTVYTSLERRAS
jgi:hypothetical protein